MTLCDAGPMVALVNRKDNDHLACVNALPRLTKPLVTTWPCIAESMYLLGRFGGFPAQDELWGFLQDGLITIHVNDEAERARIRKLMEQYRDLPMDVADASLVAAAETLSAYTVFFDLTERQRTHQVQ